MQGSLSSGAQPDGSVICLSCGLCCNGSLNFFGNLSVEEVPYARVCGLDAVDTETVRGFKIPCPLFQEQRCAIYHKSGRPQACRGYRCWVLQRYLEGELTQRKAQRIIRVAIALNARVAERIGIGKATALVRLAKAVCKPSARGGFDLSLDDWSRFGGYVHDLEGARNESGQVSIELLGNIFRAACFLRLQFMRPDPPAGQALRTCADSINSVRKAVQQKEHPLFNTFH